MDLLKGDQLSLERPTRTLAYGEAGTGKTHLALSFLSYLEEQGLEDPSEAFLGYIDLEDGVAPLLKKGVVPDKFKESIVYTLCSTFEEIEEGSKQIQGLAMDHAKDHPGKALITVDNMNNAWQWTRDQFAIDVYGMSERDLMKQRRQEALSQGKKMLPSFDQRADYAVINPMHNDWMTSLVVTKGVHVLFLTPAKSWTQTDESGKDVTTIYPAGQKENIYRVDNSLYLYKRGPKYYADLMKSREANKLFKKMPDPSWGKFARFLNKVNEPEEEKQQLEEPITAGVEDEDW